MNDVADPREVEQNRLERMGEAMAAAAGGVLEEDITAIYRRLQNPEPLPLCMDRACKWQPTGAHFHQSDGAVYGMFGGEVLSFIEHREAELRKAAVAVYHGRIGFENPKDSTILALGAVLYPWRKR